MPFGIIVPFPKEFIASGSATLTPLVLAMPKTYLGLLVFMIFFSLTKSVLSFPKTKTSPNRISNSEMFGNVLKV